MSEPTSAEFWKERSFYEQIGLEKLKISEMQDTKRATLNVIGWITCVALIVSGVLVVAITLKI